MASQITRLTSVYLTVYLGVDKRKHQSSASLAFVQGIHRSSVNSPHKGPVTRKMFPYDVIMRISTCVCDWNETTVVCFEFIVIFRFWFYKHIKLEFVWKNSYLRYTKVRDIMRHTNRLCPFNIQEHFKISHEKQTDNRRLYPGGRGCILLTRFNFNPSMDE